MGSTLPRGGKDISLTGKVEQGSRATQESRKIAFKRMKVEERKKATRRSEINQNRNGLIRHQLQATCMKRKSEMVLFGIFVARKLEENVVESGELTCPRIVRVLENEKQEKKRSLKGRNRRRIRFQRSNFNRQRLIAGRMTVRSWVGIIQIDNRW